MRGRQQAWPQENASRHSRVLSLPIATGVRRRGRGFGATLGLGLVGVVEENGRWEYPSSRSAERRSGSESG